MNLNHLFRLGLATSFLVTAACADTTEIDNKPAATVSAPSEDTAKAEPAPEAAADTAAAAASGKVWKADVGTSSIGFLGAKVTATHPGGFSDFTGEATTTDGKLLSTRFEAQVASLWADKADAAEGSMGYKLAGHLKSPDFFDAATHPVATFSSTLIEYGEGNSATVTGNLSFAGKTNSVSFPATIEVTDDKVSAKADFKINRKDWGLVYAGKPDDLIHDDVALNLDLHFVM